MLNKRIIGLLLIVLLCTSLLTNVFSEETIDYYTPENVRKFADYLYSQGDYLRAVGEYQRYLFHHPIDTDQIRYRIALCYRLGGQPMQAIRSFETLLKQTTDTALESSAYFQIGISYFLMEQFEKSTEHLENSLTHISDERYQAEAQQFIGLSQLMQRNWLAAESTFNKLQNSKVLNISEKASIYSEYAKQGMQLQERSPFLAGLMSTFVPGAGRLYTGRINDALTSLFTVGLTGWQAYDGFRRDGLSSVKGWTLGTLGGIFYFGNIYGSVISARVYNRNLEAEFLTTLLIEIPY